MGTLLGSDPECSQSKVEKMIDLNVMPVFIVSVMALLLAPGPDMVLISSLSINKGRVMGLWACLGNLTSGLVLTIVTGLGVASVIKQLPYSFDFMRLVGGGYLLYLAWSGLKRVNIDSVASNNIGAAWSCYKSAVVNNLMNPKALLFFIMFLPQFVSPNVAASPKEQLFLLGFILNVTGFIFNVTLVMILSGFLERWMKNNVNIIYQQRIVSVVFACLGGWMLVELVR